MFSRLSPNKRSFKSRRRRRNQRPVFEVLEDRRVLTIDITIADVVYNETAGTASITVNLSQEPDPMETVTVDWATADGTAESASNADYTAGSGTLSFFQTATQNINVSITNDSDKESDQTFKIDLTNASGATIVDSQAIVTIVDDDATKMTNTVTDRIRQPGKEFHGGDFAYNYSLPSGESLLYRTITDAQPIIVVETKQPDDSDIPDEIRVELTFDGNTGDPIYYDTTGLTGGDEQRFVMQFDASSLSSGTYDWSLQITEDHSGEISTRTFTGKKSIINRQDSPFGSHWWMAGLDELAIQGDDVTVLYSDGRTAFYHEDQSSHATDPWDEQTTLVKNGDDTYTLTTHTGLVSEFDSSGKLTERKDRNGNSTSYSYTSGLLTKITDPFGRELTLSYTGGELDDITDFAGNTTSFTIDANDNLTSISAPDPDGAGSQTSPIHDFTYSTTNGLMTEIEDPLDHTFTIAYDFAGRVESYTFDDNTTMDFEPVIVQGLIDPNGSTGTQGNPAAIPEPDDAVGTVTDQLDRVTKYETDHLGAVLKLTDPDLNEIDYVYNAAGKVTKETRPDPDGAGPLDDQITEFVYDTSHNLILIRLPDTQTPSTVTRSISYDTENLVDGVTNELGDATKYTRDSNGNITKIRTIVGFDDEEPEAMGEDNDLEITFTYTVAADDLPIGMVKSRTDANGVETRFTYEDDDQQTEYGWLTGITYAYGTTEAVTVSFEYDSAGNRTAEIDGLSRRTEFDYDNLNRLIEVTLADPDGQGSQTSPVFSYQFDAASRLTKITDPLSNETDFTYDTLNRLTKITYEDPDGAGGPLTAPEEQWGYDDAGQMTSYTDMGGQTTTFEYSDLGLMTKETLADPDGAGGPQTSPVWEFSYDLAGNLTKIKDPLLNETTFDYSIRNELIKTTFEDPDGTGSATASVVEYQYDKASRLTKFIDALDAETEYIYATDLPWLETIKLADLDGPGGNDPPEINYTHDANGNILSEQDPEGNTTSFTIDSFNRVTKITGADPDNGGSQTAPEWEYAFDAAGQLTSVTDSLDRVTSYTLDDLGRVTKVTLPDPDSGGAQTAPEWQYSYDAASNLTEVLDPLNNDTDFTYDNLYRLIKTTYADPDGAGGDPRPEEETEYNSYGNVTKFIDALDRETVYGYDNLHRLISVTLPDPDGGGSQTSPVWTYTLDALSNITQITDPADQDTDFEFDNVGRLIKRTDSDPDGGGAQTRPEWEWEYNANNLVTKEIDPLDRETSYQYDAWSRVTQVTLPDPDGGGSQTAPVWSYALDLVGNITQVTDPLNQDTDYTFDNLYRLTKITGADPDDGGSQSRPETEMEYDATNNLTKQIDPLDRETSYEYDDLDRLIKVILPDPDGGGAAVSSELAYSYDAMSNMVSFTNEVDETTDYTFDNLYRQTKIELPDPDNGGSLGRPTTLLDYDLVGNLTSLTDPESNETTWVFDALNRVTTETNELDDSRTWEYDSLNNVTKYTDRNGRVIEYTLDNLSRITQELWKDGANTVNTLDFSYDAASQMTSASDDDSSYDYTFDDLGRVTQIDIDNGGPDVRLNQQFNAVSMRTELKAEIDKGSGYVKDFINTYTFDNLYRLTQIDQTEQSGGNGVADKRIDFTYNAANQFTQIERFDDLAGGSGDLIVDTDFVYDEMGRLTDLTHSDASTTFADYDWAYDAASRVTDFDFTSHVGTNGSVDYSYDDNNQLTSEDYDYQTDKSWSYDENGNRTNTGYTTGPNNQLTSDGVFDYVYDDEGNRKSRTRISNDPADDYETLYEYDHWNQFTKISYKNNSGTITKEIEYFYDVFGRRIKKEIDWDGAGSGTAEEIQYIYDGDHIILALDDNDDVTNRYLHGPVVDMILADEQIDTGGQAGDVLWPLADNLGSVRDIVDSTGTIVNHLTYNAFGQITEETDDTVDHIFGFTGRERDEESDLQYNRARYYDAAVGRWISEDPIGFMAGDTNLARYVSNDAANFTDPSGEEETQQETAVEEPLMVMTDFELRCAVCHGSAAKNWPNLAAYPQLNSFAKPDQIEGLKINAGKPSPAIILTTHYEKPDPGPLLVVASIIPFVGQYLDLEALNDPETPGWVKELIIASNYLDFQARGLAPNVGPIMRAIRSQADEMRHFDEFVEAMAHQPLIGASEYNPGPIQQMLDLPVTRQPSQNTCVASCLDMLLPNRKVTNIEFHDLQPQGLSPASMAGFVDSNFRPAGLQTVRGSVEEAIASGHSFMAIVDDGHAVVVDGVTNVNGVQHVIVRDPLYGAYLQALDSFEPRVVTDTDVLGHPAIWGAKK